MIRQHNPAMYLAFLRAAGTAVARGDTSPLVQKVVKSLQRNASVPSR